VIVHIVFGNETTGKLAPLNDRAGWPERAARYRAELPGNESNTW
jgi:hypothetical protein